MRSLHSQSATVNLATGATVLSHTVTTATALADLVIEVGDGTSNLAAAAETTLTVAITIDSIPVRGVDPTETVKIGRTRMRIPVDTFPVAAGEVVAVTLTSDQAADTGVAVTATLRDASPLQPVTKGNQALVDADGKVTQTSASMELVANATRTELAVELARMDAAVSTRAVPADVAVTVAIPAIVAEDIVAGDTTTRYRGTRWTLTANDIGDEPTKIACTVKRRDDADADAILQVVLTIPSDAADGLIRLNGAAADDASHGSIAVSTYVEDSVTKRRAVATIQADATQHVSQGTYKFDFKDLGTPEVLTSGVLKVLADVTRAIA